MAFNFRRIQQGGLTIMPQGSDTTSELGDLQVLNSTNKLQFNNGSFSSAVVTEAGTATISNKTYVSPLILTQTTTPSNPPANENKLYFKSDDGLYILNSAGVEIQAAGSTAVFFDNSFKIENSSDNTKISTFDAAGISTGTTRTFSFPDLSGTLLLTAGAQTVSNKTIDNTNSITVKDSNLTLQNSSDVTKQVKFDLSNLSTGTTRIYTLPDSSTLLSSPYNIKSKSSTYTAIANDYIIATSPSSWTLTLPTAVGIAGQIISIKKTDSSANSFITVATTSAQTIDGLTNVYLYTQGEEYTFVSDGSNWSIATHKCNTPWTSYSLNITATGSNPTKSNTVVTDAAYWRRIGDSMEISYTFFQSSGSGGVGGSGAYLFSMPIGFGSMNTSIVTTNTVVSSGGNFALGTILGNAILFSPSVGSSAFDGVLEAFNSTNLYILMASPSTEVVGASNYTLGQQATYTFKAIIPITNWLP